MTSQRKCRWCGETLKAGRYAAFCPQNPNRDANSAAWRKGDRRFRFVKRRKSIVTIGPVLVVPKSPFTP